MKLRTNQPIPEVAGDHPDQGLVIYLLGIHLMMTNWIVPFCPKSALR